MKLQPLLFALLILLLSQGGARTGHATQERQELLSLCYHSILLNKGEFTVRAKMPILLKSLTNHFDWLKYNQYTPVSLDDVIAADKGKKKLPPKAVLLTFDDGYKDFYTVVFPLLKAYNYPAVFAINTKWLETPANEPVHYSELLLDRDDFITWAQAREMTQSGLIELATHTHGLHEPAQGNPQGSAQPKGVTLKYYPDKNRYQTTQEYYTEVYSDLKRSADLIAKHTGKRPRMVAWPYGLATTLGIKAAEDAGLFYSSVLEEGYTYLNEKPGNTIIKRYLLDGQDHDLSGHIKDLRSDKLRPLERIVQVDLDYIYDPDPAAVEQNLSNLIDRLIAFKVSSVYLQAYADPDGNGTADALYFPNRHLPMRADLFNWIAWRIQSRVEGTKVYAWMPVLGFEIKDPSLYIQAYKGKSGSAYPRLSPFNPKARKIIKEIYHDLAAHASFAGVLFHDDAIMGDYEDTSPAGLAWLAKNGFPSDMGVIHGDPQLLQRVSRAKTKALTAFTLELSNEIRQWRSELATARNIYAEPVLNPQSEVWFAQNFDDFLNTYTHTAIMAMPFMENADDPEQWMDTLIDVVLKHPKGIAKAIVELQTVDWRAGKKGPIDSKIIAKQMLHLQRRGIRNIGYYPDDFTRNHPKREEIYRVFSLQSPFAQ